MRKEPPLPQDVWDLAPPVVQAAVLALVEKYEHSLAQLQQQVADLQQQVLQLTARLNQNSQNSSRPPSSDGPAVKRRPPSPPSPRKRGAQPGHEAHPRLLFPLDQVKQTIPCRPARCRRCGGPLQGDDPKPLLHQVVELPPIQLDVVQYELHRLNCPHCGISTCGELPAGVPTGNFGPRLQSVLALLTGVYRMSKRMVETFSADVLGLSVSLGEVCKLEQATAAALDAPVAEARAYVQTQSANVDETSWRQNRQRAWLWVAVTGCISVFLIRLSRGAQVARELLGKTYRGILTSDRYSAYNWMRVLLRQVCWSHLRRDFQAMIDRGGVAVAIGRSLLGHAEVLFEWWYRVRDGTLARSTFQRDVMSLLRPAVRADLEAGLACGCAKTAGTCRQMLRVEPALWTFVRHAGIEPTNNAAERSLRHAVQWRKTSYGTDSVAGSHFVENILTVVASCRQQSRNVLEYLTSCCRAACHGTAAPTLLPLASTPAEPALAA